MRKWTRDELRYLSQNYGRLSRESLINHLGRSWVSLRSKAHELRREKGKKLKEYRPGKQTNKKLRKYFFREPNLTNSYWAGFIAADGYIHKGQDQLMIRLSVKDINHLKKFESAIRHPYGVKIYKESCMIQVNSPDLVNNLKERFNIVTGKSLILEPPKNLSFECSLAFVIGYIDGDGCLTSNKRFPKVTGSKERRPSLQILGTKIILEWIIMIFSKIFSGIDHRKPWKRKTNVFVLQLSGKLASELICCLKGYPVPKLERKWNEDHLLQHGFILER